MAVEYMDYLAASVLSEDRVITYRLLSRALKVHVNNAKQMLFEFHRTQNGKNAASVHATYLVSGTKRRQSPTQAPLKYDDDDEVMQSSPPEREGFPTEDIPNITITLVKEEDLDIIRQQYETISSIHVYSIGPHPLKDLQVLSDATQELQMLDADRDPLEFGRIYGTILNPGVRRRTARKPPPPPPAISTAAGPPRPAKAATTRKSDEKIPQSSSTTIPKQEPRSTESDAAKEFFSKPQTDKTTDNKPPATLKRNSSSIFKAFAKSKPRLKSETSDSTAGASGQDSAAPSVKEDEPMKDVSDDEEDDYVIPPPKSKELVESDRKSRKEREEALKKMMEDDDSEEAVVEEATASVGPTTQDIESAAEEPLPKKEAGSIAEADNGRRRGKRRVMKKKTIKDDEGYLGKEMTGLLEKGELSRITVTKEEAVWESFSEDEPTTARTKTKTPSSTMSSAIGKAKKPPAKSAQSQGSIMSFFGKPKK